MKALLPTTIVAALLTVAAGMSQKPAVEPVAAAPTLTRPDAPGHKLIPADPASPGAASSPVGLDAG